MKELPEAYQAEMKDLLGEEYEDYLRSSEEDSFHGLRVNTMKISVEDFLHAFPYELRPVPWTSNGFYYNPADPVTKHPYYYAGLYYIQEPSAMLPGEVMPVMPGDRILDVCAAPGGKSTELGAKLDGTGVLISNDVSVSRCQALLKNIERFGIRNAFVMAEDSDRFRDRFNGFFDRILIDAPCSGEGMFRKEPRLIDAWMERDSSYYVPIQKNIVKKCVSMLREGGTIVYSTCTFSVSEDEEIVQYALSLDPDLKVVPVPYTDGFVQNAYGTKLFPHRIHGEGHFVSILQKGNLSEHKDIATYNDLYEQDPVHMKLHNGTFQKIGNRKYYVPEMPVDLKGLRVLRSGLLLGEEKKNRFVSEETLPLALRKGEYDRVIDLDQKDERVMRYLKGETLDISDLSVSDGMAVVCVDGHPLGFGKVMKGHLRNQYPKGWIVH